MRRPPSPTWAPLAALVLLLAFVASASASPRITALRRQADALAARTHTALLDLYAIESRLAQVRASLAAIHSEADRVRAERLVVQRQVRITRRAYLISSRRLAIHLRTLYESGNLDALSVLFGSRSLDTALTNIDAVDRLAAQSRSSLIQTAATGRKLRRLSSQLDARIAHLASLAREAGAATAALESTRNRRLSFITSLRTRERLSRQSIAGIVTKARAAEVKSEHLAATAAASTPDEPQATSGATAVTPAATSRPVGGSTSAGTLTVVATGYSIHGHTASGVTTGWGVAAVDPAVIPLGTRFDVPGYGTAVAADVGSGVRGATIDLWFPSIAAARAWGRKNVTITIRN